MRSSFDLPIEKDAQPLVRYKCALGHTFVLGINMWTKKRDARVVSWNDPINGEWLPKLENQAGQMLLPLELSPNPSIREEPDGRVIVGERWEFRPVGMPFIWGVWDLCSQQ